MSEAFDSEKDGLETIVMTDDDGVETEFFVINAAAFKNVRYMLVVQCSEYDKDEPDAYIIKESGDWVDEVSFEFVEDDDEYNAACVLLTGDNDDFDIIL